MNRPVSAVTSNTSFNFKQTHKLGIYPDELKLKLEFRHKSLRKHKTYFQHNKSKLDTFINQTDGSL